ncbi:PAS domain-containing hybrid sensor histidine kinase/response regulator [uncultured Pontibacter sp.]|uniref:PAS domain-containing hybrid sensor histidine kinase/response regulator n=1 Tax=uncultured Pontibacter sp. TaxID=453356 RepID=UPI002607AC9D|nr:PAS domain-containing hybrid sensor histidine kinase/response regulator [uncultured Pontibacter sp.]
MKRSDIIKLAQEGLLEESIEELYDKAPCGYFSTLPDGTFIKINDTFLKWLGFEASELLFAKKLQDLLPIGDKIFYETHYYPLLQMQGFINEINFTLKGQDGKAIPVLLNSTLVVDAAGKPALCRTTVFNITDRKKYEMELLKAKNKAEDASRVKAEFLSTISHEIRTPINAIIGIVHLMRNTELTPQQVEYLSVLGNSTQNLLKLINDILDFSKIEAGKVSLDVESVHIRELVASVLHGFEAKAEEKGLLLSSKVAKKIPKYLVLDSLKLVQVLNNLISNAIKFTTKGTVTLKLKLKKLEEGTATIKFEVVDTGIGIAPDKLDLVFEDFAQANANINRTYGGTGLGLAISQRLIALHSSKLKVKSEQGVGSCFYFTLKLKVGEKQPLAKQHKTDKRSAKGVELLLVEDNKINVYVLTQFLKSWGVRFDTVDNGEKAVEQIVQQDYDLVLMDLQMPVMDGYEATRRIRSMAEERFSNVPIFALTATAQVDYENRLKTSGFNGILTKPFNPDKLYSLIASYNSAVAAASEIKPVDSLAYKSNALFNLTTFDDLMSDDPGGMLDLVDVTINVLNNAWCELKHAIKEQNKDRFRRWVQNIETCMELLHAKQLHTTLEQGASLLNQVPVDTEQLGLVEHILSTQFRLILQGLKERLSINE